MPPSRRRNSSSLLEASTVVTANLIMASSSYLLSRITPRVPATGTVPELEAQAMPPARPTYSVQPTGEDRRIVMQPGEGEDVEAVDVLADVYIKKFRERTRSDIARTEEASSPPAPWQPPPPTMPTSNWVGTVPGYQQRSYHP